MFEFPYDSFFDDIFIFKLNLNLFNKLSVKYINSGILINNFRIHFTYI